MTRLKFCDKIINVNKCIVYITFIADAFSCERTRSIRKFKKMNRKIAVAGTGYVGLSLAVLLAQHNHVTAVDIIPEKVELIQY